MGQGLESDHAAPGQLIANDESSEWLEAAHYSNIITNTNTASFPGIQTVLGDGYYCHVTL